MDGKKWHFQSNDKGLTRKLQEGITTRVFFGKNIMLSLVEIAPHTTSTVHSHPEEQWGYLLKGDCIRVQGGEEIAMKAGDFWYTPANTLHGTRTGTSGATILDIFSPPRDAYTKSGQGFAAKEHARESS